MMQLWQGVLCRNEPITEPWNDRPNHDNGMHRMDSAVYNRPTRQRVGIVITFILQYASSLCASKLTICTVDLMIRLHNLGMYAERPLSSYTPRVDTKLCARPNETSTSRLSGKLHIDCCSEHSASDELIVLVYPRGRTPLQPWNWNVSAFRSRDVVLRYSHLPSLPDADTVVTR